jgi:hypothetical protein
MKLLVLNPSNTEQSAFFTILQYGNERVGEARANGISVVLGEGKREFANQLEEENLNLQQTTKPQL